MGTLLGAHMLYQAFLLLESRCVGSSLESQHLAGWNGMSSGSSRPAWVPQWDPVSENKTNTTNKNHKRANAWKLAFCKCLGNIHKQTNKPGKPNHNPASHSLPKIIATKWLPRFGSTLNFPSRIFHVEWSPYIGTSVKKAHATVGDQRQSFATWLE